MPTKSKISSNRSPDAVPRLALNITEACDALGVGWDFWKAHVAGEVKIVRRGGRQIVPVTELQRWLDCNAESLL